MGHFSLSRQLPSALSGLFNIESFQLSWGGAARLRPRGLLLAPLRPSVAARAAAAHGAARPARV